VGDRPANEFNTVTAYGYTVFDIGLAYRFSSVRVFAQLENILDDEWNEAQFDTESRLFDEPASVSELHFTPGNPRNVRIGIEYRF
jgi:outer membrane receptor protein involved in Fe transport